MKPEKFERTTHVNHASDVVDVTVLPASVVDRVLLHGNFGAVED